MMPGILFVIFALGTVVFGLVIAGAALATRSSDASPSRQNRPPKEDGRGDDAPS